MRCHCFFKLIQQNWVGKEKKKMAEVEGNMINDGGTVFIFELLDELKSCAKEHPKLSDMVIQKLKPDFMKEKDGNTTANILEFVLLKIIMKVARKGIDMKKLYDSWDVDGSGSLDANEITNGVAKKLQISLTREDAHLLADHLDKDGDGSITYNEFVEKVNFKDLKQKQVRYMISLKNFTDTVMNEWYEMRSIETEKVSTKLKEFDDNGDGVF